MATRRSSVGRTWTKFTGTFTDAGKVTHPSCGAGFGLDEQDAERVVIKGNPLKRPQDRVQDGSANDRGLSDVQK